MRRALLGAVLLSVALVLPSSAAPSQTPFSGTTSEGITVSGRLHLLTSLSGSASDGWTLAWKSNVDAATGAGSDGTHYVGNGVDQGTVSIPPGPPTREVGFSPTFRLIPPGPPTHPPSPCRLLVTASIDESGDITAREVVVDGTIGSTDS